MYCLVRSRPQTSPASYASTMRSTSPSRPARLTSAADTSALSGIWSASVPDGIPRSAATPLTSPAMNAASPATPSAGATFSLNRARVSVHSS